MLSFTTLAWCLYAIPITQAVDAVLGVYIFSRHGDRTDKTHIPAKYTRLGYRQSFDAGDWFRSQYVASDAPMRIAGLEPAVFKPSEIHVQAPVDTVLMQSAQAFLQGLYPPVGGQLSTDTLRNGTRVEAPMDGYQLIPVHTTDEGAGSEDNPWLVGASGCANAQLSSNQYLSSDEYMEMLRRTEPFYKNLTPAVNSTFQGDDISYRKAFLIWDMLRVALLHNDTIPSSELLTDEVMFQLRALADTHEFNLAYNASSPIRAAGGMSVAGQLLTHLNKTIASRGKNKLGIQFGNYAMFLGFFGLSKLTAANPDFYGLPDYQSTLTFELFTSAAPSPFPSPEDLQVRMLFRNGTVSRNGGSTPTAYPLFGQTATSLPWKTFAEEMSKFAVKGTDEWCQACGNTTGKCAGAGAASSSASPASSSSSSSAAADHGGLTTPVAGVIGAMVTLAVVLGIEALILLLAGLRLVRKKNLRRGGVGSEVEKASTQS